MPSDVPLVYDVTRLARASMSCRIQADSVRAGLKIMLRRLVLPFDAVEAW